MGMETNLVGTARMDMSFASTVGYGNKCSMQPSVVISTTEVNYGKLL